MDGNHRRDGYIAYVQRQFTRQAVHKVDAVAAQLRSHTGHTPQRRGGTTHARIGGLDFYIGMAQQRLHAGIGTVIGSIEHIFMLGIARCKHIYQQPGIVAQTCVVADGPLPVKAYFHGINISGNRESAPVIF